MEKSMENGIKKFSEMLLQAIKKDIRIQNKYDVYVTNIDGEIPCTFLTADSLENDSSACVSINKYYKCYTNNVTIDEIIEDIIIEIMEHEANITLADEDKDDMHDFLLSHAHISIIKTSNIKENWVIRDEAVSCVAAESAPSTSDMSIYYYWTDDLDDMYDTRISYYNLEEYGLSKDELRASAIQNTMDECRPILSKIYLKTLKLNAFSLYAHARGERRDGACVIAYPKIFDSITKELQSNLYIIPISTEKLYLIPVKERDEELEETLKGFLILNNAQIKDKHLILSSNILYYSMFETNEQKKLILV